MYQKSQQNDKRQNRIEYLTLQYHNRCEIWQLFMIHLDNDSRIENNKQKIGEKNGGEMLLFLVLNTVRECNVFSTR